MSCHCDKSLLYKIKNIIRLRRQLISIQEKEFIEAMFLLESLLENNETPSPMALFQIGQIENVLKTLVKYKRDHESHSKYIIFDCKKCQRRFRQTMFSQKLDLYNLCSKIVSEYEELILEFFAKYQTEILREKRNTYFKLKFELVKYCI